MKKRVWYCSGDVHYTSDTHFGHANIIKYCDRPFVTELDRQALADNGGKWTDRLRPSREAVELMDETLIANINKQVGPDSILIHLGDWAMPDRRFDYLQRSRYYRDRLICQNIYFLYGNHDGAELEDLFLAAEAHGQKFFDLIPDARINDQQFSLNHYAQAVFNKNHRKAISLYGHSHSGAEGWLNAKMPGRRSLDVGVDNAYKLLGEFRPFSHTEIINMMKDKPGFAMDHHGAKEMARE